METIMLDSIAIPGILPTWPVVSTNNEMLLRSVNANSTIAVVSTRERAPQSQERAHASMTTNKSTGSSGIDYIQQSGDVNVLDFGMLYEKFKRPIHSYIYRLLGSQDDADDLTQEVFMRAYVAWNDLYDR